MTASAPASFDREAVRGAIAGDAAAMRAVIAELAPVVRVRIGRALARQRGRARGRTVDQESDDLCQEVFVVLFANGAKVLASWDPARGLTLAGFAGLVADRIATRSLMGKGKNPWRDDPSEEETLERAAEPVPGPEARLVSLDTAERVCEVLRAELSPLGYRAFTVLFLQEADVETGCRELGLSADAVYAWRSRIAKLLRRVADDLDAEHNEHVGDGVVTGKDRS